MEADCIYIGIGNSDDKLSQKEWAGFARETAEVCASMSKVFGLWFSEPSSQYQNACICIQIPKPAKERWLRSQLQEIAKRYDQNSISWARARTEFVRGNDGTDG